VPDSEFERKNIHRFFILFLKIDEYERELGEEREKT
jgi:hypothetical protein